MDSEVVLLILFQPISCFLFLKNEGRNTHKILSEEHLTVIHGYWERVRNLHLIAVFNFTCKGWYQN